MKKKKDKFICLFLSVIIITQLLPTNVYGKNMNYSVYFTPSSTGEYNIYTSTNVKTSGALYEKKIFGIYKLIKKSSGNYRNKNFEMKCSLKKGKTYKINVTAYNTLCKPSVKCVANYDKYKGHLFSSRGGTWKTYEGTYQPFMGSISFIRTQKIVYLTKEQAAIYCLNLDENKYLNLLDSGTKLMPTIIGWGISPTSAMGKAILKMGKSKLIAVTKTVLGSVGGIVLMPSIKKAVRDDIRKKTENFKYGLKIKVMYSDRSRYVNIYSKWDGRDASVTGSNYCRGYFTAGDIKLKGWY